MRTKTLLIAAAALAATVISSEAQTVYSANIVGYVNVVLPGNGATVLIANPLDDGNGNNLTNILSSALLPHGINQSAVFLLSGGVLGQINNTAAGWGANAVLAPGTGFYVQNGRLGANAPAVTNTFVGSVVIPSGSSVTNDIPAGYSLQGSTIPYAGNIAIAGTSGGDANLNYGGALHSINIANKSSIIWVDPTTTPPTVDESTLAPANNQWGVTVPISVGQGFWIENVGTATNMVQSLQ